MPNKQLLKYLNIGLCKIRYKVDIDFLVGDTYLLLKLTGVLGLLRQFLGHMVEHNISSFQILVSSPDLKGREK